MVSCDAMTIYTESAAQREATVALKGAWSLAQLIQMQDKIGPASAAAGGHL
jgi:hypothetical protein